MSKKELKIQNKIIKSKKYKEIYKQIKIQKKLLKDLQEREKHEKEIEMI